MRTPLFSFIYVLFLFNDKGNLLTPDWAGMVDWSHGPTFPHHTASPAAAAASSGRNLWNVAGCWTREMREAICEGATAGRYFQPAEPHDSPERCLGASGNFFSIACECEHSRFSSSPKPSHLSSCQGSASWQLSCTHRNAIVSISEW